MSPYYLKILLKSRSQNLKIKAEAVHLSEWVKVDPVEPEQVVAGELPQGGHDSCLKIHKPFVQWPCHIYY